MSSTAWGDDLPDSDLALDVFRTPGRFSELLRGKGDLGGGVRATLGRAAEAVRLGSFDRLNEPQRAALFFVQHVLLAEGADLYRVLGLRRGAGADELKDHYHLLIRILHPDRARWLGFDCEGLAARVNIAHQTLSEPAKRLSYDRDLARQPVLFERELAASDSVVPKTGARKVRRQGLVDAFVGTLPLRVQRNFAQSVLGLAALFGVLLVAGAYLSRPEAATRMQSEKLAPVASSGDAPAQRLIDHSPEPVTAGREEAAAAAARIMSGPPAASPVVSAPAVAPKPTGVAVGSPSQALLRVSPGAAVEEIGKAPQPKPATDTTQPKVPANVIPQAEQAVVKQPNVAAVAGDTPDVPPKAEPAKAVSAKLDPEAERRAAELVMARAAAIEPAPMAGAALLGIQPDEARATALRFVDAYRKGQLEAFLSLFAVDARSPSGGLAEIRRDYSTLFSDSLSRSIELGDFRWAFNGTGAQGDTTYFIRVRKHGAASDEEYSGRLRFELVKINGEVRIRGLFHKSS